MYWYAEYCRYGIKVKNERELHRFKSRKDRDMWVDNDVFKKDWHRVEISRDSARSKYPSAFMDLEHYPYEIADRREWVLDDIDNPNHECWSVWYEG